MTSGGYPLALTRSIHVEFGLTANAYVLATLHRPSNVDDSSCLQGLVEALVEIGKDQPVVFPVHPRTRAKLVEGGTRLDSSVRLIEPLGYLDFLSLTARAAVVITDSGGVQEETTYLGIPCLTVRKNTERPITISHGTNRLVHPSRAALLSAYHGMGAASNRTPTPIPFWDGKAAERIVDAMLLRAGI